MLFLKLLSYNNLDWTYSHLLNRASLYCNRLIPFSHNFNLKELHFFPIISIISAKSLSNCYLSAYKSIQIKNNYP